MSHSSCETWWQAILTTELFCWPLVLWDDGASSTLWSWGVGITDVSYHSQLPLPFLPVAFGRWKPDLLCPFPFGMIFWFGLGRRYFGCEWSYIFGWVGGIDLLTLATRSHYTMQAGSELSTLPSGEMHYHDYLQCGNETSWFHAKPFMYHADNRHPRMWLLSESQSRPGELTQQFSALVSP